MTFLDGKQESEVVFLSAITVVNNHVYRGGDFD